MLLSGPDKQGLIAAIVMCSHKTSEEIGATFVVVHKAKLYIDIHCCKPLTLVTVTGVYFYINLQSTNLSGTVYFEGTVNVKIICFADLYHLTTTAVIAVSKFSGQNTDAVH